MYQFQKINIKIDIYLKPMKWDHIFEGFSNKYTLPYIGKYIREGLERSPSHWQKLT